MEDGTDDYYCQPDDGLWDNSQFIPGSAIGSVCRPTLTMPAGELEGSFYVIMADDDLNEQAGSIIFGLPASSGYTINPAREQVVLNLISDDGSTLVLATDTVSGHVAEGTDLGNEGRVILTYTLNNPATGADLELLVSRGTRGNAHDSTSAPSSQDIDYSLSTSRLALNAGNNYTGTITLTTVADTNQEPVEESITLEYALNDITTGMAATNVVLPNFTLLIIEDDDRPRASITSAADTINETADDNLACGVGTLCRIYRVSMDRAFIAADAHVRVAFTSSDPTGATVLNTDYTIIPVDSDGTIGAAVTSSPFTLRFRTGNVATVATFMVTVLPDSDTEEAGTITFSLPESINPNTYTVADNPGAAVVTIVDEPDLTASIGANVATISEAGTASVNNACTDSPSNCSVVTVSLNQQAPAGGMPVLMALGTGGDANAIELGTDYTVSRGVTDAVIGGTTTFTVTVPENMNSASFTITMQSDQDHDEEEATLTLALRAGHLYKVTDTASMARTVITVEGEDLPVASISIRVGDDPPGDLAAITEAAGDRNRATVTVTFTPALTVETGLLIERYQTWTCFR